MDQFEKYINDHRSELDDIEPIRIDQMWSQISANRDTGRRFHWRWLLLVLLALVIIIGGFWLGKKSQEENGESIPPPLMALISEQTDSYVQLTRQKETALDFDKLNPGEYGEFLNELSDLETRYTELLQQLNENGNTEEVIQGLIRYHERKLRILDLIAKEIEYRKLEKMKQNEIEL